jgi:ABC-type multidrug transport system ATPase subunit
MSYFNFRVINHFVLQLKGCSNHEANVEARDLLRKLNLENKKNMLCSTLSGGMKRKLSLGIALIGHTKVWSLGFKNLTICLLYCYCDNEILFFCVL